MIHGAIDGYSRLITYLKCCTNNKAATVLQLFQEAVVKHGLPSRVRADYGVENVNIAWFMLNCPERGINCRSMITSSFVHNQRKERLCGEVKRVVVLHFQNIFYFMESEGILDPLNEENLLALHFVYLPRINKALEEFKRDWALHPLSSANNRSPRQLWHLGMTSLLYLDPESLEVAQLGGRDVYGS